MLLQRMLGALLLDPHVYEEIERDPEATNQAFMVVVLAGVAGGIGQLRDDPAAVGAGLTSNLAGWSLFALLAWLIGTHFFATAETVASWSELARTLGFAYTPTLLSVFGVVPVVGPYVRIVGLVWFVAAAIVAMRQALDVTTGRAVGTGIAGLIAYALVSVAIFSALGAIVRAG